MPKKIKARPTIESPNAATGFWKECCSNEVQHKYQSTVQNILIGKIKSIPVSNSYSSITKDYSQDPLTVAKNMRDHYFVRKERFPKKIFSR